MQYPPSGRPSLIGYARVSTTDQDTRLQIDALRDAGVQVYWGEQRSGVKDRPALEELLNHLQARDVLVVYKVDRLARSLIDLLRIINRIDKVGASLRSLTEPIETGTPAGRMIYQLLGVFAEFERSVIRERCSAGRAAAKQRGARFGRLRQLDYSQLIRMRKADMTYREIAQKVGASHSAVIKAIQRVASGLTPEVAP